MHEILSLKVSPQLPNIVVLYILLLLFNLASVNSLKKSVYMKFTKSMKNFWFIIFFSLIANSAFSQGRYASDSLILLNMVQTQQFAMQRKDLPSVMKPIADDASLVNPAGYFYANKREIQSYYNTMNHLDTITYNYSSGNVDLRMLDGNNALIFYPWEMDWFNINQAGKILYKEYGLVSAIAQKRNTTWELISITNQHTPEFFKELYDHKGTITPRKESP